MASLDTNVLVRYLVQDDDRQFALAEKLVVRSVKTMTNEIDGFFRQARRRPASALPVRKGLQRRMAEKDAISCHRFGGTDY